MAYRDRPPICPRCSLELVRRQRRDIWRCPRCAGTQLATAEVERRLRLLAPDLSHEVIDDVMTARRARGTAAACPSCGRPMQPVTLGGVRVARCDPDGRIWFDASELERIAERAARHEAQRSWFRRLCSFLFAS